MCTEPKIRGILAHAHIISHINYSAFSFTNLPEYMYKKLHHLILSTARWARGNYGFRVKCADILREFNMLDEHCLVALAAFKMFSNITKTGSPQPIFEEINIPRRAASKISPRHWPKTAFVRKNFYFYSHFNIYNNMPLKIKSLEMSKLKTQAKKEILLCPDPSKLRRVN